MKNRKSKADRAKWKRIAAGVIAFIIVFVMVAGMISPLFWAAQPPAASSPGESQQGISITGEAGFSGRFKLMQETPIRVRLQNNGGNFKGKMQIKIDTSDINAPSRYNNYSVPVELPAGGSKLVEMNVPIVALKPFVTVSLLDEKGRQVASEKLPCKGANPDSLFVAVLTDNEEGMNYFRQLELNIYDQGYYARGVTEEEAKASPERKIASNLYFLNETTLPNTKKALDNFNMIVINDFDTGKLTETQKQALLEWLETGGVLALGTGAGYDKVMRGLGPGIVEASREGTATIDDLTGIHDTYNLKTPDGGPVTIEKIKVTKGEDYLTQSGDAFTTIFYNGTGSVILHPFDLAVEPFAGLEGRDRFLTDFYRHQLDYKQGLKSSYGKGDWSYMTTNLPSLNDSTIFVIFGVVTLYAFLVGPALYLLLKKKDARDKGFAIIPAAAVAVTLIITVISADTAYKKPILNTVTMLEAENGSGDAKATTATGVFSPAKGDITVSFDKNVPVYFNPQNYYYYGGGYYQAPQAAKTQDAVELLQAETPRLTYFGTASWAANNYLLDGSVSLGQGFACDFYLEGEYLKGTITNNTGFDFPEVIVGIRNSLIKYTDVKDGGTVEVNQKVKLDDQYYDLYQAFTKLYGDVYDPALHLSAEEKRQIYFKQNLFMNMSSLSGRVTSYTPTRYGMSAGSARLGMPMQAMSSVSVAAVSSSPDVAQSAVSVNVTAFNYDKLTDTGIKVNGRNANEYNTNLLVMSVPLDIKAMKSFDFPYGLIQVSGISTTALYDYAEQIYMRDKGDLELMFTLLKDARIDEFQIKWELDYGQGEIFNVTAQEWEPLSKDAYTANAGDYISPEGNVTIRLLGAEAGSVNIPSIRLKGGQ